MRYLSKTLMSTCKQCQSSFEITNHEKALRLQIAGAVLKDLTIPEPTLCPPCRRQRRLAFRNERHMYHRKCDKTGKQMVAIYTSHTPFPVYEPEAWFSDQWNPLDYGQDFDFNRPFFEQFAELQKKVPRLGRIFLNNENCDFCNAVGDSKNCYLIYGSILCEDCYYGSPYRSKNCVDSLAVRDSEYCYECVDCEKCYECFYCQDCANSSNLMFCYDVDNSRDCLMCVGLRQKQYHILNKPYSKEEYTAKLKELHTGSYSLMRELKKQFLELKLKYAHLAFDGVGNENVTGDHIYDSKNCQDLFFGQQCEEVAYGGQLLKDHHVLDSDFGEEGSFLAENSGHYKTSTSLFCVWIWDNVSNLIYCENITQNSHDCFGCISLKKNQYCILNKQYSKEEYEALLPRIIEHMKKTGEWGEFFPVSLSVFGYNETVAQEYFPLTETEARSRGWNWRPEEQVHAYKGPTVQIPDDVAQASEDLSKQILICETSGKPYKLIPQEITFYKKFRLPIPRRCPDVRHQDRMAQRNPCQLWDRNCGQCQKAIKTTYAPDRPEKILCETCYLKTVY